MMEVIIVKYVQLVCVTIFMGGNANCAQLMGRSEEMNNLKVSACAADCLKAPTSNSLTECYQRCANQTESLPDVTTRQRTLDTSFNLYCRDSKRLLIEVHNKSGDGHVENEKFIYMLVIQESEMPFVDRLVYISNDPRVELIELKPHNSYNISAVIVSSNYTVQFLGTKIFTTLFEDYKPENVTEVWAADFQPIKGDGDFLNVLVEWKPARDQTCSYEVILHSLATDSDMDMITNDKRDHNIYHHLFSNLKYNEEYNVSVRGKNTKNQRLESGTVWKKFRTPSCRDFNDTSRACGPEPIENFRVNFVHLQDDVFKVEVTWNRTKYDPEYYLLEIVDNSLSFTDGELPEPQEFTIKSDQTAITETVTIKGPMAFVKLTAFLNDKSTEDYKHSEIFHMKQSTKKSHRSHAVLYAFLGLMTVGLVVLLRVYMNQIFRNFSRKHIQNMNPDLNPDLIRSITNRTMKEAIDDQTRDSSMEIKRDCIELSEKTLGEGAFGLVKHAVLIRDGMKCEVAVKMLKNCTNIEDIKQFNQEISVMKSVGKHPNIVSIIGHCTENIFDLMLLTEFCDDGNLLNFLISESKKQLRFYDKRAALAPAMSQEKYPDSLYNFDDGRKEILSKEVGCETRTSVSNPMYDDLNNNSDNKCQAVGLTATNALYLELNDKDPKPFIIDIEKSEEALLTSDNLIEFAHQVSEGMTFLARKKVVHRDLAARNILVCSNRTVKIADFGLSRDIYEDKVYRKKGQGKLPIKWLAIESMTHNEYTSRSDVWSFGILLYEIVTLGESPYPSMGVDALLKFLESGYRMERPSHCHQSLYEVMLECWRANPAQRPPFDELSSKLNQFRKLAELENEQFINLSKLCRNKCTSEANYLKPIA